MDAEEGRRTDPCAKQELQARLVIAASPSHSTGGIDERRALLSRDIARLSKGGGQWTSLGSTTALTAECCFGR
jgi:hypothetical protein